MKPKTSSERIAILVLSAFTFWCGPIFADGPRVDIQSPRDGDTFTAPANILVCADAREWNGTIVSVQFFANTTSIGLVTSANYNQFCFVWSNVVAGTYSLTAVATDNVGATATSYPVSIQVNGGGGTNQPPQVSIQSPRNGDTFTAPTNILIRQVFAQSGAPRMFTYALVNALRALPGSRWCGGFNGDKPLNDYRLARYLSAFGLRSRNLRIGSTQAKGYELADFATHFADLPAPTVG